MTVEELKSQVLSLSERDRADFARLLIDSLEESEDDLESAWEIELNRRSSEIKNGTAKGIPATVVYEKLKKEFS